MELFDVVDQHDLVIGVTNKVEAHTQGLPHRVVAVYVFDAEGRLYVQYHRSGLFDHSVGGHVSQGESYDGAVAREAEEELGLTDPLTPLAVYWADERIGGNRSSQHVHMYGLYECHPSADWRFEPNDEVGRIEPVALAEIVADMNAQPDRYTGGFILSMDRYLRLKGLDLKLVIPANWATGQAEGTQQG